MATSKSRASHWPPDRPVGETESRVRVDSPHWGHELNNHTQVSELDHNVVASS